MIVCSKTPLNFDPCKGLLFSVTDAVDGCNDACLHICSQDHVAEGKPEVQVEQATAVVHETPPKGNKQAMLVVWLLFLCNILNMSQTHSVSLGYPNAEKRVEDTMCSGVFLTKCKVFG